MSSISQPIYLDNNATTPVDPRVLEAMLPCFNELFGNAASRNHAIGRQAREAVERARRQVAALIGAAPEEILWTSGATESDNLAIQGVARALEHKGRHIITSPVEHKAVVDVCRALDNSDVTWLPVDEHGRVEPQDVARAIRDEETILVTLMHANNEVGTLNPLAEIGKVCKERGVLFHTDATQAVGKEPIDVEAMGIDLLSLSAHKLHGPKGAGALYVRRKRPRVRCSPIFHGGGHEDGLRSGTINVPGVVGLGAACEIARVEIAAESARLAALRDRLWLGLTVALPGVVARNGHPTECLPNTLNVRFAGLEGERLIFAMPRIAVSSGSACTTSSLEPSYVLRALGLSDEETYGSLRFSLGRFTTAEEIEETIAVVVNAVRGMLSQRSAKPESLRLDGDLFSPEAARKRRKG